jgi:hypothetical protein
MSAVGDLIRSQPQVRIPGIGRVGVLSALITVVAAVIAARLLRRKPENRPLPDTLPNVDEWIDETRWASYATSPRLISRTRAQQLAQTIYEAWGWLNDDEEAIGSAMASVPNLASLSRVAYEYRQIAGRGLRQDLYSRLSQSEVQRYVIANLAGKPVI